MMRRCLFLLPFLCAMLFAQTATFYADSTFAGASDGSVNAPYSSWDALVKSLGTDSNYKILLKRGSVFTGATKTLRIRENVTVQAYGTGEKPIIDGGGTLSLAKLRDPRNVLIEDVIARKINDGWHSNGHAENVIFRRCETRQVLGPDKASFWHESITGDDATGYIQYQDCSVFQSDADGFSSHGYGYALLERCTATYCGGLWGRPAAPPAAPARSRSLFVDPVNGSDSNDGLTPHTPLLTATAVNAASLPFDEINVLRGATLTTGLPFVAKSNQTYRAYGSAGRATLKPSATSVDAFTFADVKNVWVVDLRISAADEAFAISGASDGCVWSNVMMETSNHGVECSNTTTGTLAFYGCAFENNVIHGVKLDGSLTGLFFGGLFYQNNGNSGGSGLTATGTSTVQVLDVKFDGNGPSGLAITSNSGSSLVDRCWFANTNQSSATDIAALRFAPVSAASSSDPALMVKNCLITTPDPAASKDQKGISTTQGIKVYNCTFFDANANTNTRTSYGIRADTGNLDMRNNVFEPKTTTATMYFVRAAASFTNVTQASNNFYKDTGAAPNRWHDGTARSFATWSAVSTVTDDTDSGSSYTTAAIGRWVATSVIVATRTPDNYWQEATPTGAAYVGAPCVNAGANLSAAIAAAGWSDTGDYGQRPRGLAAAGWTSGFCDLVNWSPDGFTNHAYAHFKMIECTASWCEDGFHSIHQVPQADLTYNSAYDCVFDSNYQNGVTLLSFAASGTFDMFRCTITNNGEWGADLYPPTGTTEICDGCYFANNRANYRSSGAGTASIRNCVFVMQDHSVDANVYGVLKDVYALAPTVDVLNVYNSTFVLPVLDTETANYYGIYNATGGTGKVTLNNNLFTSTDVANSYYVRVSASAQLSEADYNFYYQVATVGNRSKWHNSSGVTFATWQAYNKGVSAAATDASGSHTAIPFVRVAPSDGRARADSIGDYLARPRQSTLVNLGKNLSATFRTDVYGKLRLGSGGVWNVGPGNDDIGGFGIFRASDRIVFSKLTLDGMQNVPIRINTPLTSSSQRVIVDRIMLGFDGASATAATLSAGFSNEDLTLWSGLVGAAPTPYTGTITAPAGKNVYVSFGGSANAVYGEIQYRIVSAEAAADARPTRAAGAR